jgi:hypothetical protein
MFCKGSAGALEGLELADGPKYINHKKRYAAEYLIDSELPDRI